MKKKTTFKKLLLALIFYIPLSLSGQTDSRGTDFWLTFGSNLDRAIGDAPGQVRLQIRIVGTGQAATATIWFTNLGTSRTFSVPANGVVTYQLTHAEAVAVYNLTMGVSNRSIRVTSTEPVMLYALNQSNSTTDATNVLPVPVLGTEYFQISYRSDAETPDAYGVVAIENATRVYHDGTLVATLNAGQVYFRRAPTPFTDMTGVRVTSDKPVAFFVMNTIALVPSPHVGGSRDVFFQQLPPVNTWGRVFFVPTTHRGVERVRILATQNGTNITQVGGTLPAVAPLGCQRRLTNLNAGQFVELEINIANRGAFIQANHPVGVCAYLVTGPFPNLVGSIGIGDPAIAWIPSIEQMIPSAIIAPFIPIGNTNLVEHYALIVVPTAARNLTTMAVGGGAPAPMSGGTWYDHPTAGFSYYILQLANNAALTYTFSNPEGLFVMGYGLGAAESYFYVAGSAFRTLDAAFFANNIHNQDLIANPKSVNDINFRGEIQGENISTNPGHIRWFIDGVEQTDAVDQLTWSRNLPNGTYLIVMEILGRDNVTVRIEGTLVINFAVIIVNPHIRTTFLE